MNEEIPPPPPPAGASDFIADGVLPAIWVFVQAHPLLGVLLTALVARAGVRVTRDRVHAGHTRDAVRTFPRTDKIVILARAGGRCEQHGWLAGRCDETVGLEADHIHPHSRGGWTSLANGQALCRRHNKAKAARVPWEWQLNRLDRRRADYFPSGVPTQVVRHRPHSVTSV